LAIGHLGKSVQNNVLHVFLETQFLNRPSGLKLVGQPIPTGGFPRIFYQQYIQNGSKMVLDHILGPYWVRGGRQMSRSDGREYKAKQSADGLTSPFGRIFGWKKHSG
jgi:hypothetical protein